jgi:dolichyl-phosphate beta-glucosyltransferase
MRGVHAIVVVPCYNEEKRLDRDAFRRFQLEGHRVEFCFVDDGSRDGTLGVLESLAAGDPERFGVLALDRNSGKAEAVRRGIVAAAERGADCFGFWDADLATPLSELPLFLGALASRPDIDVVYGARVRLLGREISRRPVRHYVGRIGATLISNSLGLAVYDTQCGAKLFRNTAAMRDVFAKPFLSRWIFDVEIIARYLNANGRDATVKSIYELPLEAWHDVAGSKVGALDFFHALYDLWKIHRAYRVK